MRRALPCWLLSLGFFAAWLLPLVSLSAQEKAPTPEAKGTAKEKEEAQENFIRVTRDDKGSPLTMDTAIARYTPAGDKHPGVTIDLIGAVHIGEKGYYDALNKQFEDYDVLLYELVAPPNTRIPKGGAKGSSGHPIAAMQSGMKSMLELDHQL